MPGERKDYIGDHLRKVHLPLGMAVFLKVIMKSLLCRLQKEKLQEMCKIFPLFLLSCLSPIMLVAAELVWPTPNRAYLEGKGIEAFIQPTISGRPESGLFGGVRSEGRQFHGGLDLKPVSRDRRGEALDGIFAAMPGTIRYVNRVAGNSSYGCYVVIEHEREGLKVLTLYAHLRAIERGIRPGVSVAAGCRIGTMGRSAGGYVIPKSRSHLHFEIALLLNKDFQRWYNRQKYKSGNKHVIWNGLNMVRMDPLRFYEQYRKKEINGMLDYVKGLEEAVRVRIATRVRPDFIRRYPELESSAVVFEPCGWEISFDWTGVPFRWEALGFNEVSGFKSGECRVVFVNREIVRRERSKRLVIKGRSGVVPGKDLQSILDRLFIE